MSYDEKLFNRVSSILKSTKSIESKKMFGGICFMHRGNMLCGVDGKRLMLRVGPEQYQSVLKMKYVAEMDITGRPLKGFVLVSPSGTKSIADLKRWIQLCLKFSRSLPAKR